MRATFGWMILTLIMLLSPSVANAGIGFLFERSFVVPGLTGNLTQLKFARFDTDSIPEVIATDGHTVVIYSLSGDSIMLQKTVAPEPSVCEKLEFTDLNRDGIPDIACGMSEYPPYDFYYVTVFDGASGFVDSATIALPFFYSPVNGCIANWGNMQVVDLNADGSMELFVSADEISGGWFTESSRGVARLYYSFPDSLLWQISAPLISVRTLSLPDGSRSLWGQTLECYFSELGGDPPPPSYSSRVISVSQNGTKGTFGLGFPPPCEGLPVYDVTIHPSLKLFRFDPNNLPQTELITTSWRSYSCGNDTTTITRRTLNYHLMYTTATMENIWSNDITSEYYNFAFIPGLNDYFFAFEGESLLMFYLADGMIRTRLADVPVGDKFWVTPFADSIPRLVAKQGNTVSLYTLDITTDSPEDGENHQLPVTFRLASPYPNPFNAGLSIPIDIPHPGRLTVTVHNLLGQQVAELINRDTSQGKLTLPWDASRYSSGIYFIRAIFNDQTATTKALLLK